MSQVKITCPRCGEKFVTEKAEIYECPKCGTNVRAKDSGSKGFETTHGFQVNK